MPRGFNEETTLGVCWSRKENDWMITYPRSCDGHFIHSDLLRSETFKNLVEELQTRGYDIETIRFSVKRKAKGGDSI